MANQKSDNESVIVLAFLIIFIPVFVLSICTIDGIDHDKDHAIQAQYNKAFAMPESLAKVRAYINIYNQLKMLDPDRGSSFFKSDLKYDVAIDGMMSRLISSGDEATMGALLHGRVRTSLDDNEGAYVFTPSQWEKIHKRNYKENEKE